MARNDPFGTFREGSGGVLSAAAERYKKGIANCDGQERLAELLKVIIVAGLSEREFSYLYSVASKRRNVLMEEQEESR